MRTLIAAFLAVGIALSAQAGGGVFRSKDVTVRLSDKPCEGIPAQLLGEEEAKAFRAAEVNFQGRPIPACWTLQGDRVLIVDSDGDAGYLMAAQFKLDDV